MTTTPTEGPTAGDYPLYWDEARETMPHEQREAVILDRIRTQLRHVYDTLPFYRNLYDEQGFHPDHVETLGDFTAKVPIVTKKMLVADQAQNPPFGSYLGELDPREMSRIHGSSGTSGVPTLYAVSAEDWQRGERIHAMAQWAAGIRPTDLLHIAYPFGLFMGSWGLYQGAEKLGATLFPIGITDSEKQLEYIERLQPTVFCATPSYCIHLAGVADRLGFDLRRSSVRLLLCGGEAGASLPGTRDSLRSLWGATPIDIGSTSEMYPFQTSFTCSHATGLHQMIDENYTEIVDKDDLNKPVDEGRRGAVVYTHLWRRHQPMIRFAPGDESYVSFGPCPCGRTYPRMPEGVLGRLDDMLVIRGANLFPSTIETGLRQVPGLGAEFRILVSKNGALDEVHVEVERAADSGLSSDAVNELTSATEGALRRIAGIRIGVTVLDPGALPAVTFKARRVVDSR